MIDAYPVHIGKEFCSWLKDTYLNIFVIFVPANCTGQFQPADVGLQQIIKHHFKQESLKYHVAEYTQRIENGTASDQVVFDYKLPALRDSTVSMIVNIFWILKANPSIIRKAWTKCVAKNINLSADLLQDQSVTTSQLVEYFGEHPEFYEEIATIINSDPLVDLGVETDRDGKEAEATDDLEVPLTTVIKESLGLDVALESDHGLGIALSTSITLQDGRLTAGETPSENLLYGRLSDGSELVGSKSESESDSDSSEETSEESDEEISREMDGVDGREDG